MGYQTCAIGKAIRPLFADWVTFIIFQAYMYLDTACFLAVFLEVKIIKINK